MDDDGDSHTTLGEHQDDDDHKSLSSAASVDLFQPSPVQTKARHHASTCSPSLPTVSSSIMSPATQTLFTLSQHDADGGGDLRYDFSQLSQDTADATQESDTNDDDDYDETEKPSADTIKDHVDNTNSTIQVVSKKTENKPNRQQEWTKKLKSQTGVCEQPNSGAKDSQTKPVTKQKPFSESKPSHPTTSEPRLFSTMQQVDNAAQAPTKMMHNKFKSNNRQHADSNDPRPNHQANTTVQALNADQMASTQQVEATIQNLKTNVKVFHLKDVTPHKSNKTNAKSVTNQKQVNDRNELYETKDFDDYDMFNMTLSQPGPLGIGIRALKVKESSFSIVTKVVAGSQAEAAGMKPGDVMVIKYQDMQKWRDGLRPINFQLLRLRSDSSKEAKASIMASEHKAVTADFAPEPMVSASPATSGKPPVPDAIADYGRSVEEKSANGLARNEPSHSTSTVTQHEPARVTPSSNVHVQHIRLGSSERTSSKARDNEQLATANVSVAHTLPTLSQRNAGAKRRASDNPRRIDANRDASSSSLEQDTSTVPFCKACRSDLNRIHHPLCPKHPQFKTSGAREKLEFIRRGVELGCEACDSHYQHGCVANGNLDHSVLCKHRKSSFRQNGRNRSTQSQDQTTISRRESVTEFTAQRESSMDFNVGAKSHALQDQSNRSGAIVNRSKKTSSKSGGEPNDGLCMKKKRTFAKAKQCHGSTKKRRYQYESDSGSEVEQDGVVSQIESSARDNGLKHKGSGDKISQAGTFCTKTRLVTPSAQSASAGRTSQRKKSAAQSPMKSTKMNSQIKPNWVACENPWGPSGFVEGDVVLTCPSGGFTHHETICMGDRFVASPFSAESDYIYSHNAPSEGFVVLQLTRDPMAKMPWGFSYRRHEFGGACLVSSVDPLSPAASAVYRGNESEATPGLGLRLHDMILSLNGKSVGGMTELGVAVELDVYSRELELVVSRYKSPALATSQIIATETLEQGSFDRAMDDKSRLDWYDVNGAAGEELSNIEMPHVDDMAPLDYRCDSRTSIDAATAGEAGHDSHSAATGCDSCETMQEKRVFWNTNEVLNDFSLSLLSIPSPRSLTTYQNDVEVEEFRIDDTQNDSQSEISDYEDWCDDDNAWLGCVCGEAHKDVVSLFWIQCDDCQSWYKVAPFCVGYGETEATSLGKWLCAVCDEPVDDQTTTEHIEAKSWSTSLDKPSRYTKDSGHENSVRRLESGRSAEEMAGTSMPAPAEPCNDHTAGHSNSHSIRATWTAENAKRREQTLMVLLSSTPGVKDLKRRLLDDGCILPIRTPKQKADGTFVGWNEIRGFEWDANRGMFVPKRKEQAMSVWTKVDSLMLLAQNKKQYLPDIERRLTDEGCLLPPGPPKKMLDGKFLKPKRTISGFVWDANRGLYVLSPESYLSVSPADSVKVGSRISVYAPNDNECREAAVIRERESDKRFYVRYDVGGEGEWIDLRNHNFIILPNGSKSTPKASSRYKDCILPRSTPERKGDGTYVRPTGRPPKNMKWDPSRGLYTPKSSPEENSSEPAPKPSTASTQRTAWSSVNAKKRERTMLFLLANEETNHWGVDIERRLRDDGCFLPPSAAKKNADGKYEFVNALDDFSWDNDQGVFVPNISIHSDSSLYNWRREHSLVLLAKSVLQGPLKDMKRCLTDDGFLRLDETPKKGADGKFVCTLPCVVGFFWDGDRGVFALKSDARAQAQGNKELVCDSPNSADASSMENPVPLPVGTLVAVAEHDFPGMLVKPGGVANILNYREDESGTVYYDVSYILGGGEKGVHWQYVSVHEFTASRRSRQKGRKDE